MAYETLYASKEEDYNFILLLSLEKYLYLTIKLPIIYMNQ